MNRRTIGRGRVVTGVGAILTLVGCFLPWYTVGGDSGLPALSSNAFDGTAILVFLAAVGVLFLIALPYAAGDRQVAVDRPASFVFLVAVGIAGFLIRAFQLMQLGALGLPDRAPGFWLSGLGLIVMAWGASEIVSERRR